MENESVPDLESWEAYCEACKAFREARRAQERDVGDGTQILRVRVQDVSLDPAYVPATRNGKAGK